MDKALFERLTHSMAQMNEIIEGTRQPSRTFEVDAMKIKEIRRASGLSQSKFADLISVSVDTLRNWEQGDVHRPGLQRLCCERLPMIRNMCCKHLTVRGMVMPYRKHQHSELL